MRDLVLAVKGREPSSSSLVEQHIVVLMLEGALSGRIYKAPHTVVRCACPTVGRRGCQSLAHLIRQGQRWLCSMILVPRSAAGIRNSGDGKAWHCRLCPILVVWIISL